jgi:hypothetical protein
MAGRGMGAATKGGGAVEKGPKNRMVSETSKTTGPAMMAMGGDVSPRKRMAMGMKDGGMAMGMKKGGKVKAGHHRMPDGTIMKDSDHKKGVKKMKKGGSC